MATIKEIAKKTGVSIATVSRVLNQDKSFTVLESTRMEIIKAAESLNYQVKNKKETVSNRSYKIGLLYWYTTTEELNDPNYFAIRMHIENECIDKSMEIEHIYLNTEDVSFLEKRNLEGIIALGKYSQKMIDKLYKINNNFVLVDCFSKHYNVDVVTPDLENATVGIIDFYMQNGISDIGFIGGIETTFDGEDLADARLSSYRKEMTKRNLYDERHVKLGKFTSDSGYEIATDLIKNKELQKAYIIASDAMALGCLKAFNENNVKVPQDVSVFSYENTSFSRYTIPSLSSVEMNTKLMGETAVALLKERLTGRLIGKKVIIPTKLVIRGSVRQNVKSAV